MKLIIVRHGETEENKKKIIQGHSPGVLTEKGIKENELLADLLKGHDIHHIYSSDLARAWDTAEQIQKHHDLEIKPEPLIRERSYGVAQRKTYKECGFDGVPDMTWTPEGGETLESMLCRAEQFIENVKRDHPDENVMVVTHGLLIMALLSKLLDSEFGDVNANLPGNSSAIVVEVNGDSVELRDTIGP